MKRRAAVLLALTVLIIAFAACSPAKEVAGVTANTAGAANAAGSEQVAPTMLHPAYVRSSNSIETTADSPLGSEDKWGFINDAGQFVIEPVFDYVEPFQDNGLAVVGKNGKLGLVDREGKLVLESVFSYIGSFKEGFAVASRDASSCFIDEQGKVLFESLTDIRDFSGGLAVISKDMGKGDMRYGYIDKTGKIVIDAQYRQASGFANDRAVVLTEEKQYQIIDKSGALVKALDYAYVGDLAEGMLVYKDKDSIKYGYLDANGNIAIPAAFYTASAFQDGLAVVRTGEDYFRNCDGVVNTKGEFVIQPEYAELYYLGKGLFAAADTFIPSVYHAKKAVVDKTGKRLTDFKYYEVNMQKDGLICVNDGEAAYFVNERFETAADLPKMQGSGIMTFLGNVIKAEIDQELKYISKEGQVIWQSDHTYTLNNGMKLLEKKYRPDRCMLIHYPELTGHPDKTVQDRINAVLKQALVGDDPVSEKGEDGEFTVDTSISYSAGQNKDLLIIREEGYIYPLGAAHGMPIQQYYHIDLQNGDFYDLKDLFKKDSDYLKRLSDIVGRQIAEQSLQEGAMYFDGDYAGIREDQGFAITRDGLQLYFEPYEIAPYAAGFPTFDIPYGRIIDLIDTEGVLWKSFDKEVKESDSLFEAAGKPVSIKEMTALMQETISAYQNGLVEAINSNDFSKVEPYLVKDGSLYKNQEKLVADLYKKGIKEKALDCKVLNASYNDEANEYYAYVEERAEVSYPDGRVEAVMGRYEYTVYYYAESRKCLLNKIAKWE